MHKYLFLNLLKNIKKLLTFIKKYDKIEVVKGYKTFTNFKRGV